MAGYDDLGRLLSDSCGSVWSQTFSYDQYDNITKAGSAAWACVACYNASNNQYNPTLSSSISYDANGNLLNDTFHTYAWNFYGHVSNIDTSTSLTYDAQDRVVEKNVSGTSTEILYSPLGKTAVMSGQTVRYAYIPLPGGAAVYKPNDLTHHYWHKDWLGNTKLSSTLSSSIVAGNCYAPYGESEISCKYGNVTTEVGFTGDTQDLVAGTYDTPNRELNPAQGRWISPDPAGQGWNLYAYATNPFSSVDPSGLAQYAIDYHADNDSAVGGAFDGLSDWSFNEVFAAVGANNDNVANNGQTAVVSNSSAQSDNKQGDPNSIQPGCKSASCVTVDGDAGTKHSWFNLGDWYSSAALMFTRWGRLGGPLHRAGVEKMSQYLRNKGYEVENEKWIPTQNGAKSGRFVDVFGQKGDAIKMIQGGRQNQDGSPVAREVRALDDIQDATGIRPDFAPYNVGSSTFGVGVMESDIPASASPEVTPEGEPDIPLDTDFIPE